MSKIVRYNGDVNAFASASLGTERTVFGDVTQSDLLSDQLTADFLRGWGIVGASESPTIQDFSAAMFTATQFISYLHQMGIAEWDTAQEYPTKGALTAHGGMVWRLDIQASAGDEPGTSRAWAAASGSVEPLGNKNVYYREAMVISPDPLITFPPTSGLTGDYAAGEELVLGTFAGAAGVSDVVITDNLGITWGANSIELRYDIENTSLFTQGDETIYIVDEAGVKRWLKVADIAALTSTLTVNVLAVDFDFALFAELGITSILEMGLQDAQGVFGERSAEAVNIATLGVVDAQKGINGYRILPNGDIQQWGRAGITTDGNGNGQITFPIAFPNSVNSPVISLGAKTAAVGSAATLMINQSATTLTTFNVNVTDSTNVNWTAGANFTISYTVTGD